MKTILAIAGLALSLTPALAQKVVTIDRLVDHVSSVPAIAGKNIDLFVREKVPEAIHNSPTGKAAAGKVRWRIDWEPSNADVFYTEPAYPLRLGNTPGAEPKKIEFCDKAPPTTLVSPDKGPQ